MRSLSSASWIHVYGKRCEDNLGPAMEPEHESVNALWWAREGATPCGLQEHRSKPTGRGQGASDARKEQKEKASSPSYPAIPKHAPV